jgi:hypothetical protein
MSQALVNPMDSVIRRAMEDGDFRARLLANPKRTIENDMGLAFPQGCEISVVENTPTKTTIVLPIAQGELSVEALEQAAGGAAVAHTPASAWCYHINWLKAPTPDGRL